MNKLTPSVSVVIPTYKRPYLISIAVNSVFLQEAHLGEVIVVDDNEDGKDYEATRSAISKINEKRLRFIKNNRKKGGCGARNTGILASKNEYICFLDDDDELLPGALSAHLEAFNESSIGMVYGIANIINKTYGLTYNSRIFSNTLTYEAILEGRCPYSTSVVMARKEVLIQAGLFDEALPSLQDYDMWLRIAKSWAIKSHSYVVAKFVCHQGDRTSVNLSRRLEGINYICDKWGSEISKQMSLKSFRRQFTSRVYLVNGELMLSSGLAKRPKALYYLFIAVILSPNKKLDFSAQFILGFLGFTITKYAKIIYYSQFRK